MKKYLRGVLYAITTIALYLGVSLVGWGMDDLPGFFADAPRTGYASLVVCLGLAIGWQSIEAPEGIDGSKGESGKRIKRQTVVGYVMTLLMVVVLGVLPWADRRQVAVWPEDALLRWMGLLSAAIGYALIFWSGVALGKMYSAEVTIQKDHQLVTDGLYRHIRHPRYLGLLLSGLGLAYLFRSWIGMAALVLLLVVLLYRIRDEEALMRQEFGPAWHEYCKHSWRLIPYVY